MFLPPKVLQILTLTVQLFIGCHLHVPSDHVELYICDVITERDGHCDAWTQQSNNSYVTKRNPLSLLTVYRRIYGQ